METEREQAMSGRPKTSGISRAISAPRETTEQTRVDAMYF